MEYFFCVFDTILDYCNDEDNINIFNDSFNIKEIKKNSIEIIDKEILIKKVK